MKKLSSFVLDTLQIYFPWDDDLYTYLKNRGFASKLEFKALPLIYTDDCESTTRKHEIPRNYVIDPEKFNTTPEQLGWKRCNEKGKKYTIPAEKILLDAHINENYEIVFTVVPTSNNREQYHLEYSVMSAFGKGYANWCTFYFKKSEFESFMSEIGKIGIKPWEGIMKSGYESKQRQREEFNFVELPVREYCFNIGEFKLAEAYLRNSGYVQQIPGLFYDSRNLRHRELMEPFIKFGILTTGEQGFWQRPPQVVMKISQPKFITTGGRKRRVKGVIDENKRGNYFIVDASELISAWRKV
ncbi:MAG: hypothetical protein N3D12_00875 [Candidatus Methanomethyliaceae archaeon]|nr:hypothetical protein [Candidatus Methanomethyliaceae archaeon]